MRNNDILRRLRYTFSRKPDHKHYRECKDQMLRNVLKGVQIKYCSAR